MKKQLLFAVILSITISAGVFAQEKGLMDKLKKIEGKAASIVIKTNKGTTTFSGEEAAALMKMLKSNPKDSSQKSAKKIIVLDEDDDDFSWNEDVDINVDELRLPLKKARVFQNGDPEGNVKIELSDFVDSLSSNKIHKKIVIQNRDGNKTVTVTTKENGTEKVEMFEGADAEKYLREHKSENKKAAPSSKGLKKKVKKIVIEDENEK